MTNKEKLVLLQKDLCARLPYGVKIKTPRGIYIVDAVSSEGLFSIPNNDKTLNDLTPHDGHYWLPITDDYKPYLRPMSSMTKEERGFCLKRGTIGYDENDKIFDVYTYGLEKTMEVIVFLNAHHLDYRGLIPMGLAVEASEGMYKID